MSSKICCLLYKPELFELSCLKNVMHGVETCGDGEALVDTRLTKNTRIVFYIPASTMNLWEGYEEGYSWFDENLSRELGDELNSMPQQQRVYLLAYETVADTRTLWILSTNSYEYLSIHSDGSAEHIRQDPSDSSNYITHSGNIVVDATLFGGPDSSEFDYEGYDIALDKARQPFCAFNRLKNELGVNVDNIENALDSLIETGKQLWPG